VTREGLRDAQTGRVGEPVLQRASGATREGLPDGREVATLGDRGCVNMVILLVTQLVAVFIWWLAA
jgi:hypothetical protein